MNNRYEVTLGHDKGRFILGVYAEDIARAVRIATGSEGCPERAVLQVRKTHDEKGKPVWRRRKKQ